MKQSFVMAQGQCGESVAKAYNGTNLPARGRFAESSGGFWQATKFHQVADSVFL